MAGKIIPAVLARSPKQLRRQWHLAREYGTIVHLDISDGTLVPGRTTGPRTLRSLDTRGGVEIHCMSARPDRWLETILRLRPRRVILHVELGAKLRPYIALFRSHRLSVILAINPATPLSRLWPWWRDSDGVQVMGVTPGRQGAPWHAATVKRIQQIHRRAPRLPISCDGNMTPATIPLVRAAGATNFIVGSFLQTHLDPDQAWRELQSAARA